MAKAKCAEETSVAAVKSAKRALEVIEFLDSIQRSASVAEVAAVLGYPQSSTSSLLTGLRRLGYLQYNSKVRTYALSLRVALMGMKLHTQSWSVEAIHNLVTDIRDLTGLTAILCTKQDLHMQYVYAVGSGDLDLIGPRPGRLHPLCRTAAGIVLLHRLPQLEIGKIVRRINADLAPEPRVSLSEVLDSIAEFHCDGYACMSGGVYPAIGSVAIDAPFCDLFDTPLALCVGGRSDYVFENRKQLAETMLARVHQPVAAQKGKGGPSAPQFPSDRDPSGLIPRLRGDGVDLPLPATARREQSVTGTHADYRAAADLSSTH